LCIYLQFKLENVALNNKGMGRKNITFTAERHEKIFKIYEEVVKKYGENARFMTKSHFYLEVAAVTGWSHYTIMKIVREALKIKTKNKIESFKNHIRK
jgi:predicted SpoU family rRNA methylase